MAAGAVGAVGADEVYDAAMLLVRLHKLHWVVSPRMRALVHGRYCQAMMREMGLIHLSQGVFGDGRMLERALRAEGTHG